MNLGMLTPGAILNGRYEIQEEIGRGGFSIIYKAFDQQIQNVVAIKILMPPPAVAEITRERARREVMAVRTLSHQHIIQIYDLVEEGHWLFIVMELVDGEDLNIMVARNGSMPLDKVVQMGEQIADALANAHRRGILHRDIKPQNILIDRNGEAKLTDFGAVRIEGQSALTMTQGFLGTLDYAPPEMLAGDRGDARSDIYAFGITLYFALIGELPKKEANHQPLEPKKNGYHPKEICHDLPDWVDQIVAVSTRADINERFQTSMSLLDAFSSRTQSKDNGAETHHARPCMICGAPDPLGLSLCVNCGGGNAALADTAIFIRPASKVLEKNKLIKKLATLFSVPVSAKGLNDVVAGVRALLRIPSHNINQVVSALAKQSITAYAIPQKNSLQAMPREFWILMFGMLIIGMGSDWITRPFWLIWITPAIVAGLLIITYFSFQKPLLQASRDQVLPDEIENIVISTITRIEGKTANQLFSDIAWNANRIFSHFPQVALQQERMSKFLQTLMSSAAQAVMQLDGVDQNLQRFEKQRMQFKTLPQDWVQTVAATEKNRDALVQLLLETNATLASLNQSALSGESIDQQLKQINQDIHAEVEIQAEAVKRVKAMFL